MLKRYLFIGIFSAIIIAAILMPQAAGSFPPSTGTPVNSSPDQVAPAERAGVQVDARPLIPATPAPFVTQVRSSNDGPAILNRYCTQCHPAQSLNQIEKTRVEWEKTLAQMEAMGLRLDDPEKAVLLDYLAASDQP